MGKLLSMLPANGYKTYVGGVGMVLVGVVGIVLHFAQPDSPYAMEVDAAVALVMAGLSAIGIGHKVEKLRER